jgi:hypothetical protein
MIITTRCVAKPSALPTATTGHGEDFPVETVGDPGLDYVVEITCHKRYDPDAVGRYQAILGSGNGTADQAVNAQFSQPKRLLNA